MNSNLISRKNIRLKDYDYTKAGYYFVTICTKDRKKILANIVGGGFHAAPLIDLYPIGKEIIKSIEFIEKQNKNIYVDKYTIMPNHMHMIVVIDNAEPGGHGNPPLHKIVGTMKSFVNRRYNEIHNTNNLILWQRGYFERIIRNEEEYMKTWEYIDTNHYKWENDKYYL